MKIKITYAIYALIAIIFAGLSIFTDIFEKYHFEAVFSHLGLFIGLLISAFVLINLAKFFIKELTD
ncbi:hypothetical protein [Streptococcus macacae]|nr:hypothetical protein [Streptococcus macacae]SUN78796.1 Uncharacterised protein [Streptococcus macacae NCTC 11558]